jgi:hypothetical protein
MGDNMDIVAIMKQSASLKEKINIDVYDHIFERYPYETDFDEVNRICGLGQSTFDKEGYIPRDHFSGHSEEEIFEVIDKMTSSYETIITMAFDLYKTLNKD